MRFTLSVFCLALCLVSGPLLSCEKDLPCDKCAKESEFSWNPENQHVTHRLERFYRLEEQMREAYDRRDDAALKARADEYLDLAAVYRCNWNYGNAIHDANRYLGLVSLRSGDLTQAATFLQRSGKSTGSPQLNSFGPDLSLANELLKQGQADAVRAYLSDIKRFWTMGSAQVDEWLIALDRGERPELDHRFAIRPSTWLIALGWLVITGPLLAVSLLTYVGRRSLSRKVLFLVVGISAGYASLILVNLVIVPLMLKLAMLAGTRGLLLFVATYLPLVLALVLPAAVVFALYKYFSPRDAR